MTRTWFSPSLEKLSLAFLSAILWSLSVSCSSSPAPDLASGDELSEDDLGEIETAVTRACTAKFLEIVPAPRQPVLSSDVTLGGGGTCMAGVTPEFRFSAVRNGLLQVLCDWQASGECHWDTTLAVPDFYTVRLETRRPGQVDADGAVSRAYAVGPVCTGVALGATPGAGGLVALSATATCDPGITPLYRFYARAPGGPLKAITAYGPSNTATWDSTGATPGQVKFRVLVRRPEDTAQDVSRDISYVLGGTCAASSFGVTGKGTARTMTATASCAADATPEYRFSVEDPAGGVSVLRDWASESSAAWDVTGLNGRYRATVEVRSAQNPSLSPSLVDSLVAVGTQCVVSVGVPSGLLATDAPVTLSASTNCGSPELAFLVHPSTDGRATVACDYSTATTCVWTPPEGSLPGQYSLTVRVRHADGTLIQATDITGFSLGGSARCVANDECPTDERCLGGAAQRVCVEPSLRCVEQPRCPHGTTCDAGACVPAAGVGEPCSTGRRCALGAYCSANGICAAARAHLEACDPSAPPSQCQAGTVCRPPIAGGASRCFAPDDPFVCLEGIRCSDDDCSSPDCGAGAACVQSRCVPYLSLGQSGCWHGGSGPLCEPGLYCKNVGSKIDGVCAALPEAGSPCQSGIGRLGTSLACASGNVCVSNVCRIAPKYGETCSAAGCAAGLSCVSGVENGACFASQFECAPGFLNIGGACKDIDECASGAARCGAGATCSNTPGSYTCTCPAGYSYVGGVCKDIDECATPGYCNSLATCSNTPGSYTCTCRAGYSGDGHQCTDIDECATGQADCGPHATCANFSGGFQCNCTPAYTGDGHTCSCAAPAIECGNECLYSAVDQANCGACGVSCATDQVCASGACVRSDWIDFTAGMYYTCGIGAGGQVKCWGFMQGLTFPAPLTKISANSSTVCGLEGSQQLVCHGADTLMPQGTFTAVSVGFDRYVCGIRTDQTLACVGPPTVAPPAGTFLVVSTGGNGGCAVRTDQTLACWGDDSYGQATPPSGTFTSVTAGLAFACGIRTDQTLACWGYNSVGQAAPPSGTFTAVSAGRRHVCGIRTDQTLACWGGDLVQTTPPRGTFTAVSAGAFHSCALRTDGHLACWGANTQGETVVPLP